MRHLKTVVKTSSMTSEDPTKELGSVVEAERVPYWYVEEIRGVRVNAANDGLDYLVRWSGYAETYNSWEPEKNCVLAASKVRDFYSRMPKDDRDFFIPRMTLRFLSRLDTLLADKKTTGNSQTLAGSTGSSRKDAVGSLKEDNDPTK